MAAAALRLCVFVCEQITCTFCTTAHQGGDGAGQVTNHTRARAFRVLETVGNHINVTGLQIYPGVSTLDAVRD